MMQVLLLANVFVAVFADPLGTSGGLPRDAPAAAVPAESLLETAVLPAALPDVDGAAPAVPDTASLEAAMKQAQMLLAGDKTRSAAIDDEAAVTPEAIAAAQTILAAAKAPGLQMQNVAIDAEAHPARVPASPHLVFSQPQDLSSRSSMVRREVGPLGAEALTSESPGRRLMMADGASRENMGHDDDSAEIHKNPYQEDPRFSPEAIFADKHLAPEVAEFLGHLAQRHRVHRKQVNKAARQAALAQGRAASVSPNDKEEDNNDDIEDMKRAASSVPKTTPLSHFFDAIDAKSTAASWLATDCAKLSENITANYVQMGGRSRASWATAGPAGNAGRSEVHTGMFFRHWGIGQTMRHEALRKLRLAVLSFLATQDPAKVMLHIWTDLDRHNDTIKEMLGPIAKHPELLDAINITTFDPKVEFAAGKVPPTLARNVLQERFKKDTMPHLRNDLYRSVILYNYGGLWMDADTVLMQDMVPLVGEDWAYLTKGKEGAVEGSLLSASKPRSHFATDYLISLVMREPALDGEVQKPLLVELFENDPAHTTMHVLPPCFVDSEPAAPEVAVFFSVGIQDAMKDNSTAEASVLQDAFFAQWVHSADDDSDEDKPAPTSPSWAYHWRGNFGASWARGSLADVAERTFMKKLNIHVPLKRN